MGVVAGVHIDLHIHSTPALARLNKPYQICDFTPRVDRKAPTVFRTSSNLRVVRTKFIREGSRNSGALLANGLWLRL
jgi:hypothetical protein